jgi:hypothetical protein
MKSAALIPSTKLGLFAAACLALAPIASSHAALLAVDQFNYSSITNGLASTGSGFGTWTTSGGAPTTQTGLTYSTLPTAFSSAKAGYAGKTTTNLLSPISTGTVWISFLIQGVGDLGADPNGVLLTGTTQSIFVGFGAGFSGTHTGFGTALTTNGGGWSGVTGYTNADNISNTATHWIVLALNLTTDSLSLWIDPTVANVSNGTLGAALQTTTRDLGTLTGMGFEGIGGALPKFDEFRIGTDFAPALVPEPSTYAIVGVLLFGIALMRRRRMMTNS